MNNTENLGMTCKNIAMILLKSKNPVLSNQEKINILEECTHSIPENNTKLVEILSELRKKYTS